MATTPDRFDQLLAAAEAPAPDRFDELLAMQEKGAGGDRFDALLAAVEQPAQAQPKRSLLNQLSGGLIVGRGDPGFTPASTGFAPAQFVRAVMDNPELQAGGVRAGGALAGAYAGGTAGAVMVPGIGAVPGAVIGSIVGALGAEPAARAITPREETLGESAVNVGLAGIMPARAPVGSFSQPLARMSPVLEQAAREATVGGVVGGVQSAGTTLLNEGRLPAAEEYAPAIAGGVLVGGPLGAALSPPPGIVEPRVSMEQQIRDIIKEAYPEAIETAPLQFNSRQQAVTQPAAPVELPATLQPKPPSLANAAAKAANASEMAGNTNLQQVVSQMSGAPTPVTLPEPMSPTFQSGLFDPQQALPDELRVVGEAMDQVAAQQAALGMTGGTAGDVAALRRGLAPLAAGVEPTIPSPKLPEPVSDEEALRVAKAMMGVVETPAARIEAPTPVAAALPEPTTAATAKEAQLRNALKQEGIDYQYVVFRPGMGLPDAIQVDVISPDRTQSLGSSNPAELNKLGAKIPEVPEWVPQGRYTREQLEGIIAARKATVAALKPSKKSKQPAPVLAEREFVAPAEDAAIGANNAGETLYERADGSRYRMRLDRPDRPEGYPDFGGDLNPTSTPPTNALSIGEAKTLPLGQRAQGGQGVEPQVREQAGDGSFQAPRQEPLAFTSRAPVVNTPRFERWFQDSKVVNREGRPTVMYHGTGAAEDFAAFDETKLDRNALFGPGIYSTSSPDVAGGAEGIAGYASKGAGGAPRVIPLYVKIKNPFRADDFPEDWQSIAEKMDVAASKVFGDKYNGMDFDLLDRMDTAQNIDNGTLFQVLSRSFSEDGRANAQRVLKELGYDGVIHTGGMSARWNPNIKTPHTVAIAFKPEQVKSSIGNSGAFDPDSANISGFITPQLASTVGGGAAGGATGFATTERQEGESEEQFQARRLGNTFIGAVAGAGLGAGAGILKRNPVPPTKSPELSRFNRILTAKDKPEPTMFERVSDAVGNLRYRLNTSWAPVGRAQKQIYKLSGIPFKSGRYYDLERAGEKLAGAPVKAQREVEQLFNLINDLSDEGKIRLRQYITISRTVDRLARIPEETARLQDAVGYAQSNLDNAKTAIQRQEARAALNAAIEDLNENANRLRVSDITLEQAQKALADLRAETDPALFATIEQKAEDYQSIMREVLRKRVESGLMSKETMDRLVESTDFYAPFKVLKHFDPDGGQMYPGGGRKAFTSGQLVRRITGIDDADVRLADPLEPSAEQIYKSTLQNEKNLYMRRLATLTKLPGSENYIREVPEGQVAEKGFQKVPYFTNGQKRYLEVKDDIYAALTGPYTQAEKNILISAAEKAGQVFRAGATALSVPFQASNFLIFDPLRLAIVSKAGLRANPKDWAEFIVSDYPQALLASVRLSAGRPNDLAEQYMQSGAASSTFNRVFTPEAFIKELPKEKSAAKLATDSMFGLKKLRDAAALIGNTLENTAKIAGMKRLMRFEGVEKLPPLERARKMEEIATEIRNYAGSPDFLRSGTDVRVFNTLVPFLNARWQGFTADATRFASLKTSEGWALKARLGLMIGAPAAGLYYWNNLPENEADYLEIPKEERNRYFHIPLYLDAEGNETLARTQSGQPTQRATFVTSDGATLRKYFRIPKRELPQLMANSVESAMEFAKTKDPGAFAEIGETLINVAVPVSLEGDTALERTASAFSGMNPLFRTPAELAINKDFFRNAPIVPESRLKGPAELQYRESTPMIYREAGAALGMSPARIQKVVEDITGGITRPFTPSPNRPDEGVADRMLSRFSRSERVNQADMLEAGAAVQSQRVEERVYATETAKALVGEILSVGQQHGMDAMQQYGAERIRLGVESGLINRETLQEIEGQMKEELMGYTNEQKYVRQNIPKAVRGQYYAERVKQMTPDEAEAYIADAQLKGLMDQEVAAGFQRALQQR